MKMIRTTSVLIRVVRVIIPISSSAGIIRFVIRNIIGGVKVVGVFGLIRVIRVRMIWFGRGVQGVVIALAFTSYIAP